MKEQYKKAIPYLKIRLDKLLNEKRAFFIMILLFILFYEYTQGIRDMMHITQYKITIFFFSFFMSDYIVSSGLIKVFILLAFIFIACNTTKMKNEIYYYTIRAGRNGIVIGDILFIFVISGAFVIITYLYSILCFFPNVEFQNDWGKIIGTLAYTDASTQYANVFVVPYRLVELYTPVAATLLSALLLFLGCTLLGLILYMFQIIFDSTTAGIIVSGILILVSPILIYIRVPLLYKFSPMTLISMNNLFPVMGNEYPSTAYAVTFLLIANCLLIIALNLYAKKWEIRGDSHE